MPMISKLSFPTQLHQDSAGLIRDYFLSISFIDTVLVVNSCARGQAVPESDLDIAMLVKPETTPSEIKSVEQAWEIFSEKHPTFLKYKQSSPFAHLHVDIVNGNYVPAHIQRGEPVDYFEIEIGNQICYFDFMANVGMYFQLLQIKWLSYYY